jgi:ABC-type multidrug transport system ATPase subunit/pSer/pThr/pTyr-binding forkhead associated (FHA) protein
MATTCPKCHAPIRPGAQFCSACRHPLTPTAGATQRINPGVGPSLIIQEQGSAARQQPLSQFPATIGREQAPGIILVAHSTVSRRHVRIEQRGAEYWLVDLGSTNGTSLNGNRLPKGGAYRLNDGDIFRIGDQQGNSVGITFRLGSQPLPTAPTIHLSQLNLAQLPMFTVGRDHGNQVRLDHPMVSRVHAELRRAVSGHVLIDRSSNGTYVNGQRVAGQQALRQGDVVHIGPFKLIYDQAGFSSYVTPAGNYRLDGLQLIRDVPDGGRRFLGINIGGQPKTKRILNEVNLSIYPKEFVALVGGSGAGKSTLMKALSGFTPAKPGQVLLNGDDLYRSFGAYRNILGYVPQDDIIHRQLSVRSALNYAAQLRLPDATPAELQKRIVDVLQQVEMTEHAAKPVHKLSGGQRKRVSIAVELLAEPGLFFLDEPTSGLDPGLEKKMMYTLRNLADAGRTIVLVTHATANIDQCDHVAFMADGYMAYFGPPKEALGFFGATDFADIYTKLSHPIDPVHNPPPPQCQAQPGLAVQPGQPAAEVWTRCYNASPQHDSYVAQRLKSAQRKSPAPVPAASGSSRQRVSVLRQFGVLTRRYLELIRRDTMSLGILLAVMPIIGVLLLIMTSNHDLTGLSPHEIQTQIQQEIDEARRAEDPALADEQFQASYQVVGSAQKLLFMLALAVTLLGMFGAAYEIIKEEAIYQRERMVNLKIPPYLLSKAVVLGLFALIQCATLLAVVALKVAYPGDGVFLPAAIEMYVTLVLATLAGIGLGLLVSALVRSQNMVIYIILLILFVQIIFAGAIFELPAAAKPISFLTTTRWTLEALGSTVDMETLRLDGVTCLEPENERQRQMMGPTEAPCKDGQQRLAPPYEFNVIYRHTALNLLSRWLVLLAFSGVFLGATYFVQRRKDVI